MTQQNSLFPLAENVDVIIVGNGLTGGTLAYALAEKDLKIALIDHQDFSKPFHSDGRSFALSHRSFEILSAYGLWEDLEDTPIFKIHTSDGVLPQWVQFGQAEGDSLPLGYVVESALLKEKILQKTRAHKNITLYAPTTVTRCERDEVSVRLHTRDGHIIEAPLCVASDGRASYLRKESRIPLLTWPYHQVAIVCTVSHTVPHKNQAFEHFLSSGPLAFVPRKGNTSGLVWSLDKEKAMCLLDLSPEDFREELSAHFGSALGTFTLISPRWSYPLGVCLPTRFIDTRLALVGDAAHMFHPVAGQGLNLGLRDVASLTDTIFQAFSLGLDIGSPPTLDRYQKSRRTDVMAMTLLTEGIVRVFSNSSHLLARLRFFGFKAVIHLPFLKNFMTQYAAGKKPFS